MMIEEYVSDKGLVALSDCWDMVSQMARELTLEIRNSIEELSTQFQKMAILKADGDSKETNAQSMKKSVSSLVKQGKQNTHKWEMEQTSLFELFKSVF